MDEYAAGDEAEAEPEEVQAAVPASPYARPKEEIPLAERYVCRRDCAGIVLDKRAMRIASEALGHSRINVIAGHYLNF